MQEFQPKLWYKTTLPDKTLCSGSAGVFLLRSVSFTGQALTPQER